MNLSQADHTLRARFHTTCTHCCRFPHDKGWTAVDPKQPLVRGERERGVRAAQRQLTTKSGPSTAVAMVEAVVAAAVGSCPGTEKLIRY